MLPAQNACDMEVEILQYRFKTWQIMHICSIVRFVFLDLAAHYLIISSSSSNTHLLVQESFYFIAY